MTARSIIRTLAVIAMLPAIGASTAWAAPDVVVHDAGHRKNCEAMSVAVVDQGKELTSAGFCSAGGHMSAKLFVIDGKTFVAALTGDRYDSANGTAYVRVLELKHPDQDSPERDSLGPDSYELSEVAVVVIPPPTGGNSMPPTYQIVDKNAGAVALIVDFPPTKDDPDWPAPPKRVSILFSPISP